MMLKLKFSLTKISNSISIKFPKKRNTKNFSNYFCTIKVSKVDFLRFSLTKINSLILSLFFFFLSYQRQGVEKRHHQSDDSVNVVHRRTSIAHSSTRIRIAAPHIYITDYCGEPRRSTGYNGCSFTIAH